MPIWILINLRHLCFISVDLIGGFHSKYSAGNCSALTVICTLTEHTIVSLSNLNKPKKLSMLTFTMFILSLVDQIIFCQVMVHNLNSITKEYGYILEVKYKLYTHPYYPQTNG